MRRWAWLGVAAALAGAGEGHAADAAAVARAAAIVPGASFGGRAIESTAVDPPCLVTRAFAGGTSVLAFGTHSRGGEWAAVMTPAFGRCDRPQNPYRARIVRFDAVDVVGTRVTFRRGTLACSYTAAEPASFACNRPLRCDLAMHRCDNP